MSNTPKTYVLLPPYWKYLGREISTAVMAYIKHMGNPNEEFPPSGEQIVLIKLYLSHWYNHPGFEKQPHEAAKTNSLIHNAQDCEGLDEAIQSMLEQAIDPL